MEVKPWIIGDSNYVKSTSQKLDPTKTIFVGALHGKLTAEGLAVIMNDLFDGVVYAGEYLWQQVLCGINMCISYSFPNVLVHQLESKIVNYSISHFKFFIKFYFSLSLTVIVLYAGIDTDKYKYPIGSGRVTFNNSRSYMKAVSAAFIEIKTSLFTKTVQVDPYLEDSLCSVCGVQQGPYYCREMSCFRYFTELC